MLPSYPSPLYAPIPSPPQVLSQWAAIGLYVWTLLAPVLLPNYEFG
jgi:hypothetical protein